MLIDSYGGICPNCGYDRMLVRYGSFGFNRPVEEFDKKVDEWTNMTYDIALDIDKKLGLKPEKGRW